jgi:hypothetical protein
MGLDIPTVLSQLGVGAEKLGVAEKPVPAAPRAEEAAARK